MGYFDTPVSSKDGLSAYQRAVQVARHITKLQGHIESYEKELKELIHTMSDEEFGKFVRAVGTVELVK